ncbi:hypothetical protein [Segetibacter aerophilus]|uniref:Lipoprotein n=1 Tax=Segetibacter aerophilus TaxID=670293 RepID=A0A512BBH7_9BACT|nr:hypothetical protein [Segetibacter aerophilus]GEO09328.1 hypothetical protein SAE01_18240 [Segetibacter aerophilus]
MRHLLLILLVILLGCENHSYESDKRQLIAKDEIRRKLRRARSFDITGFKEDTLKNSADTTFKNPLQYSLDFQYTDSAGTVQKKKGIVLFTPDGQSVINSRIVEEN